MTLKCSLDSHRGGSMFAVTQSKTGKVNQPQPQTLFHLIIFIIHFNSETFLLFNLSVTRANQITPTTVYVYNDTHQLHTDLTVVCGTTAL